MQDALFLAWKSVEPQMPGKTRALFDCAIDFRDQYPYSPYA